MTQSKDKVDRAFKNALEVIAMVSNPSTRPRSVTVKLGEGWYTVLSLSATELIAKSNSYEKA